MSKRGQMFLGSRLQRLMAIGVMILVALVGLVHVQKVDAKPFCDPAVCQCISPLIIDTLGHGIKMTSAENGVYFDILGNGHPVRLSWPAPGSGVAFLVLDRNRNGVIDNGTELFGNLTQQIPSQHPNGFLALAEFDKSIYGGNGDGIIDNRDLVFASLMLWFDDNHDGVAQPEELRTLQKFNIRSISLQYQKFGRTDQYGNGFLYRARLDVGTPPAVDRWAYDLFLTTTD